MFWKSKRPYIETVLKNEVKYPLTNDDDFDNYYYCYYKRPNWASCNNFLAIEKELTIEDNVNIDHLIDYSFIASVFTWINRDWNGKVNAGNQNISFDIEFAINDFRNKYLAKAKSKYDKERQHMYGDLEYDT